GACLHATSGAEAEIVALALEQLVLGDLQPAVPDALHAPEAAVVVHGSALAGAPGHGDHAVAVARAAIQLAAGVVVLDRLEHAVRQLDPRIPDHPAQRVAQGGGDLVLVADGDRGIQRGHQLVAAGEFDAV